MAAQRTVGRPAPVKVLYRITEAMELLGLGRTVIYELIRSGRSYLACRLAGARDGRNVSATSAFAAGVVWQHRDLAVLVATVPPLAG